MQNCGQGLRSWGLAGYRRPSSPSPRVAPLRLTNRYRPFYAYFWGNSRPARAPPCRGGHTSTNGVERQISSVALHAIPGTTCRQNVSEGGLLGRLLKRGWFLGCPRGGLGKGRYQVAVDMCRAGRQVGAPDDRGTEGGRPRQDLGGELLKARGRFRGFPEVLSGRGRFRST